MADIYSMNSKAIQWIYLRIKLLLCLFFSILLVYISFFNN